MNHLLKRNGAFIVQLNVRKILQIGDSHIERQRNHCIVNMVVPPKYTSWSQSFKFNKTMHDEPIRLSQQQHAQKILGYPLSTETYTQQ